MSDAVPTAFDLDAYLARIGYTGPRQPTRAVLEDLHLAHVTHVPFENLDIQLGRPIRLDLESLQAKLVRGRRGGYCFEQNTLFGAALGALGFRVTPLEARVRLGATRPTPRTHMVLRVDLDGGAWLADVGFGCSGPLKPVALHPGRVVGQFAWSFRLLEDAGRWLLQAPQGDSWGDLYTFTLEPPFAVDYQVANHYTSTHPNSHFVLLLIAQRTTPEARYALRNRELIVDRGGQVSSHTLPTDDDVLGALAETFGLVFPHGTRFRCLTGA
jgi:N-hydroxyarylamine O-acetyltransferase